MYSTTKSPTLFCTLIMLPEHIVAGTSVRTSRIFVQPITLFFVIQFITNRKYTFFCIYRVGFLPDNPNPLDQYWPCTGTVINDHDWQLGNCPLFNVLFYKMPLDGRKEFLVGSSVGRLNFIVEIKGSWFDPWFDPCLTIVFLTVFKNPTLCCLC